VELQCVSVIAEALANLLRSLLNRYSVIFKQTVVGKISMHKRLNSVLAGPGIGCVRIRSLTAVYRQWWTTGVLLLVGVYENSISECVGVAGDDGVSGYRCGGESLSVGNRSSLACVVSMLDSVSLDGMSQG
jgi:hypothetical protein